MNLTEQIYRLLDDPANTLVFPTENTARHYLCGYVRQRRSSILSERAIAFDVFRAKFSPRHVIEKPANKYHRLSFVSDFLGSKETGLKYLYKDRFYDYRQRFVSFLSGILPSLSELTTTGISNPALFSDLKKLERAYGKYLEKNGLFEPGWEFCSLENARDLRGKYVLVGADADVQMQSLLKELGKVDYISTLDLQEPETGVYEQFPTEEAELEALFARLASLRLEGVDVQDIILTTPRLKELASRLERKALEFDVPLSFMKSLSLSETVPGRYLFALRRCLDEDLSFASMENLLLDAALPFRDIEVNRRLIRFMIDHNIQSGSIGFKTDELASKLFSELKREERKVGQEELDLYKVLRYSLNAIRNAKTGDELIKDIHGITCDLFGNDEFSGGDPMDKDVYSFIFTELSNINRTLKANGLKMDSIFRVFMGEVDRLSYVTQEKREGIRVYAYGQDYLMDVPHRFVFGLNDRNALTQKVPLSFLDDHEVSTREVLDVTDKLLDYYLTTAENVHITGSETAYDGAQSAPTYFVMRKGGVLKMDKPEGGFCDYTGEADQISERQAEETWLDLRGIDLSKKGTYPVIENPNEIPLSYTSIDNYATCPYKAMLSKVYPKEFSEVFEPAKQDDKLIGEFLHNVIQNFMAKHFNTLLTSDKLEAYCEEISEEFDRLMAEDRVFDDYTKQSIKGNYLEALKNVLRQLLDPDAAGGKHCIGNFIPRANEYRLNADPLFTGRIDTVIESEDGKIYLLDYKKGAGNATYQLVLYKHLYEDQTGEKVEDCFFYSMAYSEFRSISPAKWVEQDHKLINDMLATREGYVTGSWVATPSKDHCARCSERNVCRRRFNLQ